MSFTTGSDSVAVIRGAKREDLLALARFLARGACPDRQATNRSRALRQAAIARAAQALEQENRLHLMVEHDGSVCAALPLRVSRRRIFAEKPIFGREALRFDPRMHLRLIEHVAQCCQLGGWPDLVLFTDCGSDAEAQSLAAGLQARGFAASAARARVKWLDQMRFGARSHRITVTLKG